MKNILIVLLLLICEISFAVYCPIYLGNTIERVRTKSIANSWEDFSKKVSNADERNILEWYLLNTQLEKDSLLSSTPGRIDESISRYGTREINLLENYYSNSIFVNKRINRVELNKVIKHTSNYQLPESVKASTDLNIIEVGRTFKKGEKIDIENLLISQREILKRIQNADLAIEQASTFIFYLHKFKIIDDSIALNFIFHHFLSDLNLVPSIHGLPSFNKSLQIFNSQMVKKVFWGEILFADMYQRAMAGIDVLDTSIPFLPYVSPTQAIKDSKGKLVIVDINYYEFAEYCRENPNKGFKDNLQSYLEKFNKWSVAFNSGKNKDFTVMRTISDDFQEMYFNINLKNPEKFKIEMDIFYLKETVFRGQPYTKRFSDIGGLEFFVEFKPEFLSMRGGKGGGIIVKPFIKKDFELYNRLVKSQDMRVMKYIEDHMTMGELYESSPFASTSKVDHVAKRFSKGFLRTEKNILAQKSQVVAEYRQRNGFGTVDVNRLRSLTAEWEGNQTVSFGSQYARQQEVMVAGGLSPDALVTLTIKDVENVKAVKNTGEFIAEADVVKERVFTRDKNDPSIIHIVETIGDKVENRSYRIEYTTFQLWDTYKFIRI